MKKIRFIHGADLHLDSPFQGLKDLPEQLFQKVRESTFGALQTIINQAISHSVDFVILAGDLFDGENRSLKAQSRLKKAMEQLNRHGISCYIIHGNHDHLKGNWVSLSWPSNVFFFKAEVDYYEFTKNKVSVNIYGYSYPEKSVSENISIQYIKTGSADFHIGILHGTAEGQEGHDQYAPFSVKELIEKDFDYWALGHIHKRQILHSHPPIIYSGNTQGRHKKELAEKGVFLVEIDEAKSSELTFLPTAEILWEELEISIEGIDEIDELKSCCEAILEKAKKAEHGLFVVLRFIGVGPLHNYLLEQADELIEVLNVGQEEKSNFTFIVAKRIETVGEWDRQNLKNEGHLISDIVATVDDLLIEAEPLANILAEIYSHPKLRRYLDSLSKDEQKQLLKEAENTIIAGLIKELED